MHWPLGLYRVAGSSMEPAYRPGDTLIGWRWFRLRPRQVVIVRRQDRPLIKRVISQGADGVWVEGDNAAASTDSRHFGPLARRQIEAVVIGRI